MLTLDGDLWATLRSVNRSVNGHSYKTDMQRYGREEFWAEIDQGGDCEDYALEKRRRLLAAGVPLDALKIAICRTETGEGHAVLMIDTNKGAYVLDNRRQNPTPWEQLPYQWLMRQRGKAWVKILP